MGSTTEQPVDDPKLWKFSWGPTMEPYRLHHRIYLTMGRTVVLAKVYTIERAMQLPHRTCLTVLGRVPWYCP